MMRDEDRLERERTRIADVQLGVAFHVKGKLCWELACTHECACGQGHGR
jgi:hypothetical protein